MFLSVISLQGLEIDILSLERKDAAQGRLLRVWMEQQVLPAFAERILPIDVAVTRAGARPPMPDPRPVRHALIAAAALVHGMKVVTRNVADIAATGVPLLDPWSERLCKNLQPAAAASGSNWLRYENPKFWSLRATKLSELRLSAPCRAHSRRRPRDARRLFRSL